MDDMKDWLVHATRANYYHCQRCKRPVDASDGRNRSEVLAILIAHRTFNCTADPFAGITQLVMA